MKDSKNTARALPSNTAVIGRIPGYNQNIDSSGEFAKELLKGVTFIDLRPMTYVFDSKLIESGGSNFFDNLKKPLSGTALFKREIEPSKKIFKGILSRMQKDFGLSDNFAETDMIRIIGANDSTFTETFSNSYDERNGVLGAIKTGTDKISGTGLAQGARMLSKGLKSYSHASMIEMTGNLANTINSAGGGAGMSDILAGALVGLDMAMPTMWQQSNYSSTLTLFIKLVAPVGTPECIQKNILEPILYLLAAGSPLTYSGIMYGFPLLWDVQAHGITDFRLGGIAAMSLIRGSFETTFNHLIQPTVVDVRLTLIPLLNEFAAQTDSSPKSIHNNPDSLGVQNPSDIVRGITNSNINGSSSNKVNLQDTHLDIRTIKL